MAKTTLVDQVIDIVGHITSQKDVGHIKTNRPKVFKYKTGDVVQSPDNVKLRKDVIWRRFSYVHDRGISSSFKYALRFTPHRTASKRQYRAIVSNNGNFKDTDLPANFNANYACTVICDAEAKFPLEINAPRSSITILHSYVNDQGIYVVDVIYDSGSTLFSKTRHHIHLKKGVNGLGIYFYRQESGGSIEISGDLGSFISSFRNPTIIDISELKPSISTVSSVFVDSRFEPTLANVVQVERPTVNVSGFGEAELSDIAQVAFYREEIRKLDYNSISGWGDDSFAVLGDRLKDFVSAGICIMPGPYLTRFVISGAEYKPEIDQTIVNISGSLTASTTDQTIYITSIENKFNINYPENANIISGIDTDIVKGTSYTYHVSWIDKDGNESFISDPFTTTAGDFTPPSWVSGTSAVGSLKSINLFWNNPNENDLKGIHIWDRDNPNATLIFEDTFEGGPGNIDGYISNFGGIIETSSEQFFRGKYSLKFTLPATSSFDSDSVFGRTFSTVSGRRYLAQCWIYVVSGTLGIDDNSKGVRLAVAGNNANLQPIVTPSYYSVAREYNKWHKLTMMTPAAGAVATGSTDRIGVLVPRSGLVYIDDVSIWELHDDLQISPIATLNKGTQKVPDSFTVQHTTSGTLIDQWDYRFYASTFDWAGNENLYNLPVISGRTRINILTSQEGDRIQIDDSDDTIKFYTVDQQDGNNGLVLKIGSNIQPNVPGVAINDGWIYMTLTGGTTGAGKGGFSMQSSRLTSAPFAIDHSLDTSTSYPYVATIDSLYEIGGSTTSSFRNLYLKSENLTSDEMSSLYVSVVDYGNYYDYAAKFIGAKVFVEKDLIVSGQGQFDNLSVSGQAVNIGSSVGSFIQDIDGNTKVETEQSVNEDKIRFTIGGTEKAIIDSTGLGLGTSSPSDLLTLKDGDILIHRTGITADARLQLSVGTYGSPTQAYSFIIDNDDFDNFKIWNETAASGTFILTSDGKIGINKSPDEALDVYGRIVGSYGIVHMLNEQNKFHVGSLPYSSPSAFQKLKVIVFGGSWLNDTLGETVYTISSREGLKVNAETHYGGVSHFNLKIYDNGSDYDIVIETDGQNFPDFSIRSFKIDSSGALFSLREQNITINYDTTGKSDVTPHIEYIYSTNNNGDVGLGIGGSNPTQKLDVGGSVNISGSIELGDSTSTTSTPYIDFHYGKGSAQDYNVRLVNDGNERIRFQTATGGTIFSLNNTGLGILTSSASQALEVNGHIKMASNNGSIYEKAFGNDQYRILFRHTDVGQGVNNIELISPNHLNFFIDSNKNSTGAANFSIFADTDNFGDAGAVLLFQINENGAAWFKNKIQWASGLSYMSDDQTGNIELGSSNRVGVKPYIDFHYGVGSSQDYNVRLQNIGDNSFSISNTASSNIFVVSGSRIGLGGITVPAYGVHSNFDMAFNNTKRIRLLDNTNSDDNTSISRFGGNAVHIQYDKNSLIFDALGNHDVEFRDSSGFRKTRIMATGIVSGTRIYGSPVNWAFVKDTSQTTNGYCSRNGVQTGDWPTSRNGTVSAIHIRNSTTSTSNSSTGAISFVEGDRIGVYATWDGSSVWTLKVRKNGADTSLSTTATSATTTDLILITVELLND